ncbi:hypothetical protein Plhal304r1_c003g0012971 [Plasmopara halstedii]
MSAPPLHVTASSFFRFECDHEQLFQSEYKRSNRTKGLKILRCFPHCCPEHIERSYCGSSLSVSIRLAERPIGATSPGSMPNEVLAVFARFEAVSDKSLHIGECVEMDKIQRSVQTDTNLDGQWIAGVPDRPSALVVPIKGSDSEAMNHKPLIFHLNNKAFPRWYYDWESGANKAQRLMKHQFKAYVMERVDVDTIDRYTTFTNQETRTQLYRVLHIVSSTEFTVISYRRAPLDLQAGDALQAGKAHVLQVSKRDKHENGRDEAGSLSGSKPLENAHPIHHPNTYPLIDDLISVPIVRKRDNFEWNQKFYSPSDDLHRIEAKRRRRTLWTRSKDEENVHPLKDQLIWAHTNGPIVAVSKNITLLFAFASWVPIRLYASFVQELVDVIKLKILDEVANFTKDIKSDCFTRLILQHTHIEDHSRATGISISHTELNDLLRVAFQTIVWFFSHETRQWMRAFFCSNASLVLDRKAMRQCFVEFLHEVEETLTVEVLATSTLCNLSKVTDQVIAAVYSNECFYNRRPLVRQILSDHTFAGWSMFVAQLRDTFIDTSILPLSMRDKAFHAAFPPQSAFECDLNGEWLLDIENAEWNINEIVMINGESRMPDISLSSVIEVMSQILRFELAIDFQERSLRVRAPRSLAGHLNCMHLVLDGKARVFRMLPDGMSSCASEGAFGDYFGEMQVKESSQVVILLEIFKWSLEESIPSYHVRSCIEFNRDGRFTISGDILATTEASTFTGEENPYIGEMTLFAKRKLVEYASTRRFHATSTPRDTSRRPCEEYGRFRLCYRKL